MCAGLPTRVKMEQPVNRMAMVKRVNAHRTSKENTVTKVSLVILKKQWKVSRKNEDDSNILEL